MMAEKRIRLTVLMLNAAGDALWDVLAGEWEVSSAHGKLDHVATVARERAAHRMLDWIADELNRREAKSKKVRGAP